MPLLVFFLLNHPTALQCLRGCASEWGKWRAACKGRRLWPLADMHELWASQHSSGLICDRSVERASANGCVLQRMLNGRTPAQYCQGFQCWNRTTQTPACESGPHLKCQLHSMPVQTGCWNAGTNEHKHLRMKLYTLMKSWPVRCLCTTLRGWCSQTAHHFSVSFRLEDFPEDHPCCCFLYMFSGRLFIMRPRFCVSNAVRRCHLCE